MSRNWCSQQNTDGLFRLNYKGYIMAELTAYKQDFIKFLIHSEVLSFGEFITKSGRKTPYFINIGNISNGEGIYRLGEFYAHAIHEKLGTDFDNLYGPAYKGIPLVVVTSACLHNLYDYNASYTFNRKEAKSHGEKGLFIGHQPQDGDRVIIVEDVITAGTSIYESVPLLKKSAEIDLKAVVVSVDRQEKGNSENSALSEICSIFGVKTFGIVTVTEIIEYLYENEIDGKIYINNKSIQRINEYREQYGAAN